MTEETEAPPLDGTVKLPPQTGKHGAQRATRKQAQAMAKSKKRDVRRKGLRLLREASRNIVRAVVKHNRADANVVAIRSQPPLLRGEDPADRTPGEIVFGMRTGLFGHPTTTVLRVKDETIIGALEDKNELGQVVTQLGLLTAAALFNYNLAWGPDGLAKAMAAWAGIDVEALKQAAERDAAEAEEPENFAVDSVESTEAAPDSHEQLDPHTDTTDLGGEA